MLQLWINTRKVWYSHYLGMEQDTDENGDFTGEPISHYSAPRMLRANLSAARGTSENDIFGTNLRYSKTLSTSKMDTDIDELTLLWDKEPELDDNGEPDPKTAKYRVVGVAAGHYHIHYALRQMNPEESEDE